MGTKSPGMPQRCRLILQHCLAIQLCKPGHTPDDFWMYDSGYMIFQNFLAANSQCWWNAPLTAATRALKYAGHVAPGLLLVTADQCALEVLRGAYARSVLKPPATYIIHSVGDIDDCIVTPTAQGQFTPLTEALCDVIMDLTSVGQSATIENMKVKLTIRFPHMQSPSVEMIYDTLAQLMQEGKIYQTSKGYFIVTPERRRSRSHSRNKRSFDDNNMNESNELRTVLMTNSEALHSLYGEISTERDGDLTHQCIQTNLADVICGGNPNDKILYPRNAKRRSASFPTPRSLERRHSLRLFGSSKRLQRCASTRSLSKNYAQTLLGTDSSSSEYQSTDSSAPSKFKKKASLLSRLFRRSGRSKQRQLETYSAQFPPAEWFNSRAVHLHSVGTQTVDRELPQIHTLSNSTFYDGSELSNRSSTLPRRHHRRHMSSESTFVISSRDCSPIRRRSPAYCSGSLPRSTHSVNKPSKTSSSASKQIIEERNTRIATSKGSNDAYRGSPTRILNDRNDKLYRNVQSGPSSLESGKASIMTTSTGPSSIESNSKHSYSRTSGHSSLESHCSTNTVQSPNRSFSGANTSSTGQNNPSPKRQSQLTKVKMVEPQNKLPNSMQTSPVHQQHSTGTKQNIPNSNSNSSITLQVTTNSNSSSQHPSTKIYVQNSPVRSVITLENGKLRDNSNVFIINNETTTNTKGDVIKRTLSRQNSIPSTRVIQTTSPTSQQTSMKNKENFFHHEQDTISETTFDDSISMISEISPDSSLTPINNSSDNIIETSKFTKNINNDATMNNSRKLSLQINPNNNNNNSSSNNNHNNSNVYKNFLKNNETQSPTSPINNKNVCLFENSLINNTIQSSLSSSSIGNLRYFNENKMLKSVNENQHPNVGSHQTHHNHHNQQLVTDNLINLMKNDTKLNSNPTINKCDSNLANLLHKNIITVGSEPNLISIINKNNASNDNITTTNKIFDKLLDIDKEKFELRRLSLNKDINTGANNLMSPAIVAMNGTGGGHGSMSANDDHLMYNFPSLTDLSFNFTSLAAKKILQGASINSIDTLVELNMANNSNGSNANQASNQDKQKNNLSPVCTDYGMV